MRTWIAPLLLASIFGGGGFGGGSAPVSAGDGLALSAGGSLSCNAASASVDGCVTTSAQTFAGTKTFSLGIQAPNLSPATATSLTMYANGFFFSTFNQLTVLAQLDGSGNWIPGTSAGSNLGSTSSVWSGGFINILVLNGGALTDELKDHNGVAQFTSGFGAAFKSLDTCSASLEGAVEMDTLSGVNTGHRTRLCFCRSTGSNSYAWQNIAGASLTDLGTSTTCPD